MLCTNCKMTRPDDEAPCQHCGAPSSRLKLSYDGSWGWGNNAADSTGTWNNTDNATGASWNNTNNGSGSAWGNGGSGQTGASWGTPGSGMSWGNDNSFGGSWNNGNPVGSAGMGAAANMPQLAFDTTSDNPPAYSGTWPLENSPAQRRQTGDLQAPQSPSLLPALYQGGEMAMPERRTTTTLQLLPDQMAEQLLPALPEQPAEELTYVPPMYTTPRPLIPKYRVISGLLSVIIVALLLCGGAGYYAQASGKLTAVQSFFTGTNTPPNLKPSPAAKIPDPPNMVDYGPAVNVITSATLTSRLDPTGKIAVTSENLFRPKQAFYITFTIQKQDQDGTITMQWYTNKLPFTPVSKQIKKTDFNGQALNGVFKQEYDQPAEGIVELYWNNQLAQRLYFAVR